MSVVLILIPRWHMTLKRCWTLTCGALREMFELVNMGNDLISVVGFRNLRRFNLALLWKQGRNLKVKYFPPGDFLDALWVIIQASFDIVSWLLKIFYEKGYWWRIGDGYLIKIRIEPWIRHHQNYKPYIHMNGRYISLNVCDLIHLESRTCNLNMLSMVFDLQEVQSILRIPMYPYHHQQKLSIEAKWEYSKHNILTCNFLNLNTFLVIVK